MKRISLWKIMVTLAVFSPVALFPPVSRAALLTSRPSVVSPVRDTIRTRVVDILTVKGISRDDAEEIMDRLSPREIEALSLSPTGYLVGASNGGISESLESNETVAIVLTLIMLAVVVGAVEISRH